MSYATDWQERPGRVTLRCPRCRKTLCNEPESCAPRVLSFTPQTSRSVEAVGTLVQCRGCKNMLEIRRAAA